MMRDQWLRSIPTLCTVLGTLVLATQAARAQAAPEPATAQPETLPRAPTPGDICAALEAIADGIGVDQAGAWLPLAQQHRDRRSLRAVLRVAQSEHVDASTRDAAWRTLIDQTGRDDLAGDRAALAAWVSEGDFLTSAELAQRLTEAHAARAARIAAGREQSETELARVYRLLYERSTEEQRQELLVQLIASPRAVLQAAGLDLADREALSARPLSPGVIAASGERLASDRPAVRMAAARLLTRVDGSSVMDQVVAALEVEDDPDAAAALLRVLQRHPQARALPTVMRWLGAPQAHASDGAAAALLALHQRTPIPEPSREPIVGLLHQKDITAISPDGVALLCELGSADEARPFLRAGRVDVARAAAERLALRAGALEDLLDAAMEQPALFDIALGALKTHLRTADGYQRAKALPAPSGERRTAALREWAADLPAPELLRAAQMEQDNTSRVALLSAGVTPARLADLLGTDPSVFGRREIVSELIRLRLAAREARAVLDVIEAIPEPEAASLFEYQRITALVMLNRLDEAASRHAELTPRFCDAWLDALAHSRDLEHGPQIAARVELLFVPTMTDAQRLRFDVLRTELPKAQAQPEQETVVPNDS